MTTQTPSIALPTRRGPGRRLRLGLAATALIAVAAGAGLWQVARDGGGSDPAGPPTTTVEQTAVTRPVAPATTLYVVRSEAQADGLRAALAEADAIRAQLSEAPLGGEVAVVADREAERFFRLLGEQDAVRDQLGLASVTVIDLRAAATATTVDPLARELDALTAATAAPARDGAPVTTQGGLAELYGQQQADRLAEEAARWRALGGADAPYATTPGSTCASFEGAGAC